MKHLILRPYIPFLLLALALLSLAALYLFPSAWEFPMDDTYIHFVYAQNLAEHGRLMFNDPGEMGVGTTSLTWVLLLAGADRLGIPLQLAAKALGLLALVGAAWGLYLLLLPVLGRLPALSLAILVCGSGHLVWFALSGMETVLCFAIGVLSLLLYRDQRWLGLGLALGLLALTRPDGLALAAAVITVEAGRMLSRRSFRGYTNIVHAVLICLLVCAPWFAYLLWRTGHILPTSAVGKQVSSLLAIRLVAASSPALSLLAKAPPLIYLGAWLVYLLEFTLGGMALPGPALAVGASLGSAGYSLSLLGLLGWLGIILPLLVSFVRWLKGFVRDGLPTRYSNDETLKVFSANLRYSRQAAQCEYSPFQARKPLGSLSIPGSNDLPGQSLRVFLVFAAWLVLHNLAYAFFLPIPGTASRYGVINHLALWLALFIGLRNFPGRPLWQHLLAAGLVLIAGANTLYWNRVYDANLEHMLQVRIAAARYVTAAIPPAERCAAFDVGGLRYYSARPVIDLGGLIDPRLGQVYRTDGRIDRYLTERGVRCVILPGQTGASDQGWFDFAREMGLTASPFFRLQEEKVFAIDHQRWLLGYLPTNNYQATVTIYRIMQR